MTATHKTFKQQIRIRFGHCDPAGIMYYPSFFHILNDVVEDWFREGLDCSLKRLLSDLDGGAPIVNLKVKFMNVCSQEDILDVELVLSQLGKSSARFHLNAYVGDKHNIDVEGVMVCVNKGHTTRPWPASVRAKMTEFLTPDK